MLKRLFVVMLAVGMLAGATPTGAYERGDEPPVAAEVEYFCQVGSQFHWRTSTESVVWGFTVDVAPDLAPAGPWLPAYWESVWVQAQGAGTSIGYDYYLDMPDDITAIDPDFLLCTYYTFYPWGWRYCDDHLRACTPGPDAAEINWFHYDECENIFWWQTSTEINVWGFRLEHPGAGWSGPMIWAGNYGTNHGLTYAIRGPLGFDMTGDYWLRVYYDDGSALMDDVADRVCEWSYP